MKFLVDRMLGKLVTWLRISGYDTIYVNNLDFDEKSIREDDLVLSFALRSARTLLTRDKELYDHAENCNVECYYIKSNDTMGQLRELLQVYKIDVEPRTLRCSVCNSTIRKMGDDEGVQERSYVPPEGEELWICTSCGRIYWKGSHWRNMQESLDLLKMRCVHVPE
jgi:hypothetical protein